MKKIMSDNYFESNKKKTIFFSQYMKILTLNKFAF